MMCLIIITALYQNLVSNLGISATFRFLFLVQNLPLIPGVQCCRNTTAAHSSLLWTRCAASFSTFSSDRRASEIFLWISSLSRAVEEQMEACGVLAPFRYVMYRSSLHVIVTRPSLMKPGLFLDAVNVLVMLMPELLSISPPNPCFCSLCFLCVGGINMISWNDVAACSGFFLHREFECCEVQTNLFVKRSQEQEIQC